MRGKKLRASAKKLGRYLERVSALLAGPIASRPFSDALEALRAHAFRPFDPAAGGPFTKLGLPAAGTSREGAQQEPLVTAACLCVLSGLLAKDGSPADDERPRAARSPHATPCAS